MPSNEGAFPFNDEPIPLNEEEIPAPEFIELFIAAPFPWNVLVEDENQPAFIGVELAAPALTLVDVGVDAGPLIPAEYRSCLDDCQASHRGGA